MRPIRTQQIPVQSPNRAMSPIMQMMPQTNLQEQILNLKTDKVLMGLEIQRLNRVLLEQEKKNKQSIQVLLVQIQDMQAKEEEMKQQLSRSEIRIKDNNMIVSKIQSENQQLQQKFNQLKQQLGQLHQQPLQQNIDIANREIDQLISQIQASLPALRSSSLQQKYASQAQILIELTKSHIQAVEFLPEIKEAETQQLIVYLTTINQDIQSLQKYETPKAVRKQHNNYSPQWGHSPSMTSDEVFMKILNYIEHLQSDSQSIPTMIKQISLLNQLVRLKNEDLKIKGNNKIIITHSPTRHHYSTGRKLAGSVRIFSPTRQISPIRTSPVRIPPLTPGISTYSVPHRTSILPQRIVFDSQHVGHPYYQPPRRDQGRIDSDSKPKIHESQNLNQQQQQIIMLQGQVSKLKQTIIELQDGKAQLQIDELEKLNQEAQNAKMQVDHWKQKYQELMEQASQALTPTSIQQQLLLRTQQIHDLEEQVKLKQSQIENEIPNLERKVVASENSLKQKQEEAEFWNGKYDELVKNRSVQVEAMTREQQQKATQAQQQAEFWKAKHDENIELQQQQLSPTSIQSQLFTQTKRVNELEAENQKLKQQSQAGNEQLVKDATNLTEQLDSANRLNLQLQQQLQLGEQQVQAQKAMMTELQVREQVLKQQLLEITNAQIPQTETFWRQKYQDLINQQQQQQQEGGQPRQTQAEGTETIEQQQPEVQIEASAKLQELSQANNEQQQKIEELKQENSSLVKEKLNSQQVQAELLAETHQYQQELIKLKQQQLGTDKQQQAEIVQDPKQARIAQLEQQALAQQQYIDQIKLDQAAEQKQMRELLGKRDPQEIIVPIMESNQKLQTENRELNHKLNVNQQEMISVLQQVSQLNQSVLLSQNLQQSQLQDLQTVSVQVDHWKEKYQELLDQASQGLTPTSISKQLLEKTQQVHELEEQLKLKQVEKESQIEQIQFAQDPQKVLRISQLEQQVINLEQQQQQLLEQYETEQQETKEMLKQKDPEGILVPLLEKNQNLQTQNRELISKLDANQQQLIMIQGQVSKLNKTIIELQDGKEPQLQTDEFEKLNKEAQNAKMQVDHWKQKYQELMEQASQALTPTSLQQQLLLRTQQIHDLEEQVKLKQSQIENEIPNLERKVVASENSLKQKQEEAEFWNGKYDELVKNRSEQVEALTREQQQKAAQAQQQAEFWKAKHDENIELQQQQLSPTSIQSKLLTQTKRVNELEAQNQLLQLQTEAGNEQLVKDATNLTEQLDSANRLNLQLQQQLQLGEQQVQAQKAMMTELQVREQVLKQQLLEITNAQIPQTETFWRQKYQDLINQQQQQQQEGGQPKKTQAEGTETIEQQQPEVQIEVSEKLQELSQANNEQQQKIEELKQENSSLVKEKLNSQQVQAELLAETHQYQQELIKLKQQQLGTDKQQQAEIVQDPKQARIAQLEQQALAQQQYIDQIKLDQAAEQKQMRELLGKRDPQEIIVPIMESNQKLQTENRELNHKLNVNQQEMISVLQQVSQLNQSVLLSQNLQQSQLQDLQTVSVQVDHWKEKYQELLDQASQGLTPTSISKQLLEKTQQVHELEEQLKLKQVEKESQIEQIQFAQDPQKVLRISQLEQQVINLEQQQQQLLEQYETEQQETKEMLKQKDPEGILVPLLEKNQNLQTQNRELISKLDANQQQLIMIQGQVSKLNKTIIELQDGKEAQLQTDEFEKLNKEAQNAKMQVDHWKQKYQELMEQASQALTPTSLQQQLLLRTQQIHDLEEQVKLKQSQIENEIPNLERKVVASENSLKQKQEEAEFWNGKYDELVKNRSEQVEALTREQQQKAAQAQQQAEFWKAKHDENIELQQQHLSPTSIQSKLLTQTKRVNELEAQNQLLKQQSEAGTEQLVKDATNLTEQLDSANRLNLQIQQQLQLGEQQVKAQKAMMTELQEREQVLKQQLLEITNAQIPQTETFWRQKYQDLINQQQQEGGQPRQTQAEGTETIEQQQPEVQIEVSAKLQELSQANNEQQQKIEELKQENSSLVKEKLNSQQVQAELLAETHQYQQELIKLKQQQLGTDKQQQAEIVQDPKQARIAQLEQQALAQQQYIDQIKLDQAAEQKQMRELLGKRDPQEIIVPIMESNQKLQTENRELNHKLNVNQQEMISVLQQVSQLNQSVLLSQNLQQSQLQDLQTVSVQVDHWKEKYQELLDQASQGLTPTSISKQLLEKTQQVHELEEQLKLKQVEKESQIEQIQFAQDPQKVLRISQLEQQVINLEQQQQQLLEQYETEQQETKEMLKQKDPEGILVPLLEKNQNLQTQNRELISKLDANQQQLIMIQGQVSKLNKTIIELQDDKEAQLQTDEFEKLNKEAQNAKMQVDHWKQKYQELMEQASQALTPTSLQQQLLLRTQQIHDLEEQVKLKQSQIENEIPNLERKVVASENSLKQKQEEAEFWNGKYDELVKNRSEQVEALTREQQQKAAQAQQQAEFWKAKHDENIELQQQHLSPTSIQSKLLTQTKRVNELEAQNQLLKQQSEAGTEQLVKDATNLTEQLDSANRLNLQIQQQLQLGEQQIKAQKAMMTELQEREQVLKQQLLEITNAQIPQTETFWRQKYQDLINQQQQQQQEGGQPRQTQAEGTETIEQQQPEVQIEVSAKLQELSQANNEQQQKIEELKQENSSLVKEKLNSQQVQAELLAETHQYQQELIKLKQQQLGTDKQQQAEIVQDPKQARIAQLEQQALAQQQYIDQIKLDQAAEQKQMRELLGKRDPQEIIVPIMESNQKLQTENRELNHKLNVNQQEMISVLQQVSQLNQSVLLSQNLQQSQLQDLQTVSVQVDHWKEKYQELLDQASQGLTPTSISKQLLEKTQQVHELEEQLKLKQVEKESQIEQIQFAQDPQKVLRISQLEQQVINLEQQQQQLLEQYETEQQETKEMLKQKDPEGILVPLLEKNQNLQTQNRELISKLDANQQQLIMIQGQVSKLNKTIIELQDGKEAQLQTDEFEKLNKEAQNAKMQVDHWKQKYQELMEQASQALTPTSLQQQLLLRTQQIHDLEEQVKLKQSQIENEIPNLERKVVASENSLQQKQEEAEFWNGKYDELVKNRSEQVEALTREQQQKAAQAQQQAEFWKAKHDENIELQQQHLSPTSIQSKLLTQTKRVNELEAQNQLLKQQSEAGTEQLVKDATNLTEQLDSANRLNLQIQQQLQLGEQQVKAQKAMMTELQEREQVLKQQLLEITNAQIPQTETFWRQKYQDLINQQQQQQQEGGQPRQTQAEGTETIEQQQPEVQIEVSAKLQELSQANNEQQQKIEELKQENSSLVKEKLNSQQVQAELLAETHQYQQELIKLKQQQLGTDKQQQAEIVQDPKQARIAQLEQQALAQQQYIDQIKLDQAAEQKQMRELLGKRDPQEIIVPIMESNQKLQTENRELNHKLNVNQQEMISVLQQVSQLNQSVLLSQNLQQSQLQDLQTVSVQVDHWKEKYQELLDQASQGLTPTSISKQLLEKTQQVHELEEQLKLKQVEKESQIEQIQFAQDPQKVLRISQLEQQVINLEQQQQQLLEQYETEQQETKEMLKQKDPEGILVPLLEKNQNLQTQNRELISKLDANQQQLIMIQGQVSKLNKTIIELQDGKEAQLQTDEFEKLNKEAQNAKMQVDHWKQKYQELMEQASQALTPTSLQQQLLLRTQQIHDLEEQVKLKQSQIENEIPNLERKVVASENSLQQKQEEAEFWNGKYDELVKNRSEQVEALTREQQQKAAQAQQQAEFWKAKHDENIELQQQHLSPTSIQSKLLTQTKRVNELEAQNQLLKQQSEAGTEQLVKDATNLTEQLDSANRLNLQIQQQLQLGEQQVKAQKAMMTELQEREQVLKQQLLEITNAQIPQTETFWRQKYQDLINQQQQQQQEGGQPRQTQAEGTETIEQQQPEVQIEVSAKLQELSQANNEQQQKIEELKQENSSLVKEKLNSQQVQAELLAETHQYQQELIKLKQQQLGTDKQQQAEIVQDPKQARIAQLEQQALAQQQYIDQIKLDQAAEQKQMRELLGKRDPQEIIVPIMESNQKLQTENRELNHKLNVNQQEMISVLQQVSQLNQSVLLSQNLQQSQLQDLQTVSVQVDHWKEKYQELLDQASQGLTPTSISKQLLEKTQQVHELEEQLKLKQVEKESQIEQIQFAQDPQKVLRISQLEQQVINLEQQQQQLLEQYETEQQETKEMLKQKDPEGILVPLLEKNQNLQTQNRELISKLDANQQQLIMIQGQVSKLNKTIIELQDGKEAQLQTDEFEKLNKEAQNAKMQVDHWKQKYQELMEQASQALTPTSLQQQLLLRTQQIHDLEEQVKLKQSQIENEIPNLERKVVASENSLKQKQEEAEFWNGKYDELVKNRSEQVEALTREQQQKAAQAQQQAEFWKAKHDENIELQQQHLSPTSIQSKLLTQTKRVNELEAQNQLLKQQSEAGTEQLVKDATNLTEQLDSANRLNLQIQQQLQLGEQQVKAQKAMMTELQEREQVLKQQLLEITNAQIPQTETFWRQKYQDLINQQQQQQQEGGQPRQTQAEGTETIEQQQPEVQIEVSAKLQELSQANNEQQQKIEELKQENSSLVKEKLNSQQVQAELLAETHQYQQELIKLKQQQLGTDKQQQAEIVQDPKQARIAQLEQQALAQQQYIDQIKLDQAAEQKQMRELLGKRDPQEIIVPIMESNQKLQTENRELNHKLNVNQQEMISVLQQVSQLNQSVLLSQNLQQSQLQDLQTVSVQVDHWKEKYQELLDQASQGLTPTSISKQLLEKTQQVHELEEQLKLKQVEKESQIEQIQFAQDPQKVLRISQLEQQVINLEQQQQQLLEQYETEQQETKEMLKQKDPEGILVPLLEKNQNLQTQNRELISKLDANQQQLIMIQGQVSKLNKTIIELQDGKEPQLQTDEFEKLNKEAQNAKMQVDHWKQKYQELMEQASQVDRLKNVENENRKLEERVSFYEKKVQFYESKNLSQEEIGSLEETVQSQQQQISTLEQKIKQQIEEANYWHQKYQELSEINMLREMAADGDSQQDPQNYASYWRQKHDEAVSKLQQYIIQLQQNLDEKEEQLEQHMESFHSILKDELKEELQKIRNQENFDRQRYDSLMQQQQQHQQQHTSPFDNQNQNLIIQRMAEQHEQEKDELVRQFQKRIDQLEQSNVHRYPEGEEWKELILKFEKHRQNELQQLRQQLEQLQRQQINTSDIEFYAERRAYENTINQLREQLAQDDTQELVDTIEYLRNQNFDLKEQVHYLSNERNQLELQLIQSNNTIDALRDNLARSQQQADNRRRYRADVMDAIDQMRQDRERYQYRSPYKQFNPTQSQGIRGSYERMSAPREQLRQPNYPYNSPRLHTPQQENRDIVAKLQDLDEVKQKYQLALNNLVRLESQVLEKLQQDDIIIE